MSQLPMPDARIPAPPGHERLARAVFDVIARADAPVASREIIMSALGGGRYRRLGALFVCIQTLTDAGLVGECPAKDNPRRLSWYSTDAGRALAEEIRST